MQQDLVFVGQIDGVSNVETSQLCGLRYDNAAKVPGNVCRSLSTTFCDFLGKLDSQYTLRSSNVNDIIDRIFDLPTTPAPPTVHDLN
jgi:hypothetical protein